MRMILHFLLAIFLFGNYVISEEEASSFQSFTGRVARNRVRMRLQPDLDSPIVRELDEGELLVVSGESEDFYAVIPPKDTKAYLSRRFVLEEEVDGTHVNVRLGPDLDSPVIAQLNSGDRVEGAESADDKKWLQIKVPQGIHFYVSRDFIEKVGGPGYAASQQARLEEISRMLSSAYMISQAELQKPFEEIDLNPIFQKYHLVIEKYSDYPEQTARARELMNQTQEAYLKKKAQYLEAKERYEEAPSVATAERGAEPEQHSVITEAPHPVNEVTYEEWAWEQNPQGIEGKILAWIPVEKDLFEQWEEENEGASFEEYYQEQEDSAIMLSGVLQPYNRSVRNKPGDYILLHKITRLPIAYLYSTRINLHKKIGKEVTVKAAGRPNHNFAYPAYFVFTAE